VGTLVITLGRGGTTRPATTKNGSERVIIVEREIK
jgi:hypothetical protein